MCSMLTGSFVSLCAQRRVVKADPQVNTCPFSLPFVDLPLPFKQCHFNTCFALQMEAMGKKDEEVAKEETVVR